MSFRLIFQVSFLITLANARVRSHHSDSTKWSTRDWLIFGVIVGVCTIVGIIVGVWRWYRARKIKRQTNLSAIPQITPQQDFQQGILDPNVVVQIGAVNYVPGYPMNPQFPQSGNYPPGLVYTQPGNYPPGSVYTQPEKYPPGLIYPQPNSSSVVLESNQVEMNNPPVQPHQITNCLQSEHNYPSPLQNSIQESQ
ncbi:unnamed protein product [Blepharisma stoltei]|uniref:Uncharacterized protein n=1 Tax=Blepharisma stoltei TaxID=1481888 RepID=A0AAU9IP29_9CILI|nr:unnamed protein product [Blepharisma stoltei]